MRSRAVPIAVVAIVAGILACGGLLLHRAEGSVNHVALAAEAKSVTVTPAKAAKFREVRRYIGTLEPWQQAKIGPQLASGFVDTVLVRPGAAVKRGDDLATLDCRNASAGSAAIGHQARALAERQKASTREAARMNELLDGGFAAANEVDLKTAQVAANDAQIQALLAQGSSKTLEVNDCILRAPFDGEVATRLIDPGAFVRPGASLMDVVDRSIVRLTAFVPEIDFEAVPEQTPVRLRLLATKKALAGVVARRAPSADLSTRTIRFEVDLPNTERDIPTGTTAEIEVDVGALTDAIEVPLVAAKVRGSRATLFVVENDVAKKVQVDVLGERGDSLFVKPQLAASTLVVTQGRSLLANNDRVAVKVESAK